MSSRTTIELNVGRKSTWWVTSKTVFPDRALMIHSCASPKLDFTKTRGQKKKKMQRTVRIIKFNHTLNKLVAVRASTALNGSSKRYISASW